MRTFGAVCFAACASLALFSFSARASEGFDDLAKLAKSGITEDVIVAFVQSSPVPYDLTVDEILYLRDLGVSTKAITEVVDHGKEIRAGNQPVVAENDTTIQPLDVTPPLVTDDGFRPVNLSLNNDPNAPADPNDAPPQYVSPLTGDVSSVPEVIHEQEVVRDTVYTPTVVTAPADGEATLSTFYETLTPYGTWVNLNNEWVWQPSVTTVDVSWRPYCHRGHWAYTDSGWCWNSDYSWGWAPFHYGRWYQADGYGWVWHPDTVWAPSWVSWRQSDSHWAWAPLPPAARYEAGVGFHFGGKHWGADIGFGLTERDYCYVPREHFCDTGLHLYLAPREQWVGLYGHSTIIQTNIVYNDNRIIVRGPAIVEVRAVSHHDIVELRLTDNHFAVGVALTGTTRVGNGELAIYRPAVRNVATVTPAVVAARQLEIAEKRENRLAVADVRLAAAHAKADELREHHFAVQDSRRQEALTRQSANLEEAAARQSDFEQRRLNTAMAKEQSADKRAEYAAKLAEERKAAEDARLRKGELEKQAAEQRRLTQQAAIEQNKVARAKTNSESLKMAENTKAQLAAERAAREQAQRTAALEAEKARGDARNKALADKGTAKETGETARAQADAQRKATLAAERAAAEQRRAQLEAARNKQPVTKQPLVNVPTTNNQPPVTNQPVTQPKREVIQERRDLNQEKLAAERAAAEQRRLEAEAARNKQPKQPATINQPPAVQPLVNQPPVTQPAVTSRREVIQERREVNQEKLAAERAAAEQKRAEAEAARKAAAEARRQPNTAAPKLLVNPKTGKTYDPNDPNDPNNPRKKSN